MQLHSVYFITPAGRLSEEPDFTPVPTGPRVISKVGMPAIIQVENVHKTYRIGKVDVPALRGVSLSVERGEFVSIVGPSGSGKSTQDIEEGGLTRADSGRVIIDNADFAQLSDPERTKLRKTKIGFVFQKFNLLPTLTALNNITIAQNIAGSSANHDPEHFTKITRLLGVDKRLDHRPSEMSGGEQQRVALARALINKPALILADEPTGNLDTKNSQIVLDMLRQSNKEFGQTVLMITHNPEAAAFGDRIIHMRDGEIVPPDLDPQWNPHTKH
jgi:putative ABC transport system ATP-binding protein